MVLMRCRLVILVFVWMAGLHLMADDHVMATQNGLATVLSNGLVEISINSKGQINKMSLNGGSNVIGSTGVYFDFTSKSVGNKALNPSEAKIVKSSDDYAEVVYSNTTYGPRYQLGFIMRKGVSGVYMYVLANTSEDSPNWQVQEARVCTRLASSFLDGYVDDAMQGMIPSCDVMKSVESGGTSNTAYVQDATYRLTDGSIYTKYNWAQYIVRDSVHGLMNTNPEKPEDTGTGVWNIPCSREWYPGGPMKQELTVHATGKSPITIQMLQGEHFGTSSIAYQVGRKKIYGPFLIYLNKGTRQEMIADAKREAHKQEQQWPFGWFNHENYPHDRATVMGQIDVTTGQRKDSIQVVLCESTTELYRQNEGYIYWAMTDANGQFSIKNVRKGDYVLKAYATAGDNTDELSVEDIKVNEEQIDLKTITWTPKKYDNQLFVIGENNRMSDGFRLSDTLRNYGLWNLVPASLSFKVGTSKAETDWWYAQTKNGTWTIVFNCNDEYAGNAVLTTSIAGVTNTPKVAVAINGTTIDNWSFLPNDAAIYRSAVLGGRHQIKTCTFSSSLLRKGENQLTLTMSGIGSNGGVMWDCLKLETGNLVTSHITSLPSSGSGPVRIYNLKGMLLRTYLHQQPDKLNLPTGIYIYQQGDNRRKIYVK